jgi:hypothetical protein
VQPTALAEPPIPTHAGDSVLGIPPAEGRDDAELVREVAREVMARYVEADHLRGAERDHHIERRIRELEAQYAP